MRLRERERGFAVTARDSRDQAVPDHAHRRHRDARLLCFRKRQAHILEYEGQNKSSRVGLPGDLVTVDLVRAPAEHRARHDVDERLWIEPTLSDHGNDFSEHLQRRRAHHIAEQFEEVCVLRVGTDHKCPLSKVVEDRLAALDIGGNASGDDEQLARLGSIRIPEHRRSYITLSVARMLARQERRSRRANRAHRQMDCAGHQTRGQTVETDVPATEHDFAHGIVVRQHADDNLAVEQIADIGRRSETECLKPADLVRAADIGDHPSPGGCEVRGHRRSHVTKPDKADFAHDRPVTSGSSVASLARQIPGCTCEGKRRAWLVLGHGGSWPAAAAPFDAHLATDTSRYLATSASRPCLNLPRS